MNINLAAFINMEISSSSICNLLYIFSYIVIRNLLKMLFRYIEEFQRSSQNQFLGFKSTLAKKKKSHFKCNLKFRLELMP